MLLIKLELNIAKQTILKHKICGTHRLADAKYEDLQEKLSLLWGMT